MWRRERGRSRAKARRLWLRPETMVADGGGKKCLNPEYILKVGPTGFAEGLGVGGTEREESGISP